MSFLAPLFLFGSLAIALPIVFHLIRRSSRERIPFSSLMFLRSTIPKVTRQSRLENILLLLMRCLVLLLLALGFARPFIQKPMLPPPRADQPGKLIVLLDTSASMRRENLWSAAVERARSSLRDAGPFDQVAIVTFDRKIRQLVTFDEWSAMEAADRVSLTTQRLEATTPGWYGTDLANALIAAAELFDEGQGDDHSFGGRRIILISDLQEGSKISGLQGYEWPKGVDCRVEVLPASRQSNAGFQVVIDTGENIQLSTNEAPRLRVVNAADSASDQFKISWVEPSESPKLDVYVPPGASRIFQAPELSENEFGERLLLIGDEADFDNDVYYVPQKAETISVTYLGNEDETDPEGLLYFLKRAFQSTKRHVVRIHRHLTSEKLPGAEIEAGHFMIIGEALPDSQTDTVREFLETGKNVLLVLKSTESVRTLGTLVGNPALPAQEIASQRYSMLGEIRFDHPLFAPFADPRFSDFTKTHFWKYRKIDINDLPNARTVASFDDGNPAILEIPVGKGLLLILTSSWRPSDSQLARSSKFVPLLYSALDQTADFKSHRFQFWVGDPVRLSNTNITQGITVIKPDGSEVRSEDNGEFSETDLRGIYTVASTVSPWRFAVNLDPSESKTAAMPHEELERLGVPIPKERPAKNAIRDQEERAEQHATELESQQKFWRWIIFAALVFVAVETFYAGQLGRRTLAIS